MQRIPRIVGRQEKSLEKFVLSPDNKWIAFLGDAGYILLCSNQVSPCLQLPTACERRFSQPLLSVCSRPRAGICSRPFLSVVSQRAQTKGWVASLKMEGSVRSVAFSPDSTTLISGGENGTPHHRRASLRLRDLGGGAALMASAAFGLC